MSSEEEFTFKETEIGSFPDDWEVMQLGVVAEKFIGGGTPSTSKEEYWNGETHWTTSKKINGIYLLDGEKKITKRGLEESSTHLIPKDNLVIGTRVGVGKVAINKVDIAISQDLTGAFIDKEKYALEFLAYQICTKEIQNIFKERARGTTIKGIPRDDLKKIPLIMTTSFEVEVDGPVIRAHGISRDHFLKRLREKGLDDELSILLFDASRGGADVLKYVLGLGSGEIEELMTKERDEAVLSILASSRVNG